MERSRILAHRGLFETAEEKNSFKALGKALEEGFGIETDLRYYNGDIIISHDPPQNALKCPTFGWLLDLLRDSNYLGKIALNIKSDGLFSFVQQDILKRELSFDLFFAFDMSIPDTLSYFRSEIPTYIRSSEYELHHPLLKYANGVWLDSFDESHPKVPIAKNLLSSGIPVTIVSSELHGNDRSILWEEILASGIFSNPSFTLCTDFPYEAENFMKQSD